MIWSVMMTRLVCISDTHNLHYYIDLPPGDILCHAGDWSFRGEKIEQILVKEWIKRISVRYKHVIFISGNHDINFTPDRTADLPDNCYHLHDTGIKLEGIYFYGSAYTPRFGDWGFGETEDKLEKRFAHIPKKTQVLLTHGPAYSILDKNRNGELCGSKALYAKIKNLPKLKLHLFGHIHEGAGIENIENIVFANCSQLDEYYRLTHKPLVFDL